MRRILRHGPSPAIVIACVALGIALGGTSVAAVNALPRNSVGTKQLKKNAVTSPKVKDNTITGADVNEGTLAQVPSAANATSATSAASAASATNAANAANATNAGNSDKLDGFDANGLVRAARGVGPAFPSTVALGACGPAESVLATVTITAPGPGLIDVAGSVTARNGGAGGTARVHVFGSNGELSSYDYASVGNASGAAVLQTLSAAWVYTAAAAGPFTVQLRGCSFASGADAFGGQLRALFVPFGATGASSLGVPLRPEGNSPADPAK